MTTLIRPPLRSAALGAVGEARSETVSIKREVNEALAVKAR